MKKLALGIIAAIGFVSAAQAADMAVKARPVVAPVAMYDWSGIYVGASVGWQDDHYNWAFNPPIPAAPHQAYGLRKDSGMWGVHGGIQKQWGQFVLGAEIGWLGNFGGNTAIEPLFGSNVCCTSQAHITDGIFEVGGRAGVAFNNWLFYGTAGYARTTIDTRGVVIGTGVPFFPQSVDHDGVFAGVGLNYGITQNWVVGAEYQHIWFDTKRHCPGLVAAGPGTGVCTGTAIFVDRDIKLDTDIVRVSLSYKFNPWPAAVVAKY
jgi:outer membrane immunogenic protein